jgi:hypothetical protein
MQDTSIHPRGLARLAPARPLVVATLVLVAGCGGSSGSPSVASTGGAATAAASGATTSASRTTSAGAAASAGASTALAFARCMRTDGVPNFPDPSPGRGLEFPAVADIDRSSPAFRTAQAKCRKLLPGGGPPGPGSTTHPSAKTLAKLLRIARCMRRHRISQFPDPRTSVPSNLAGISDITDFDGAILLFPSTMNLQAPAYRQALVACDAPPLGLPH